MESSGHFQSHGGPQFLRNTFNTSGGPIHVDSNIDNKAPTRICELPTYILCHNFVGREDELQRIDEMLITYSGDPPCRCVVHGMPGLGKTQLALKFASYAFRDGQYPYVFWVSAASEEKLTQDFSKLAELLHLPGRQTMERASKLTMVRAWLEDSNAVGKWMIVLDNASEETTVTLRDILPRGDCQGTLLMTTRIAALADVFTGSRKSAQLALQSLKIIDAVALLSASASSDGESQEFTGDATAERLVRLVGKLPLAVDQAASFIRESGCSPQEVIDVFESDEASEILSWENDLSPYETKSVAATFTPALKRIQEVAPDAVTLLRMFSFCDPEGIPVSMFKQGCDAIHQETQPSLVEEQENEELLAIQGIFQSSTRLSKAIREIQRISLAVHTREGPERIMRIHDLVHFLLRSKLMTDAERAQWLDTVILIVCKAFEKLGDVRSPGNWSQYSRFVSHIESLEGFAEQYKLRNVQILNTSRTAGYYLMECGLSEKAATLAKRISEKQTEICGEHDSSTLSTLHFLAQTVELQGKYEEAENLNRKVLAVETSVLGKEHEYTLASMNNLAGTLVKQGKYEEAENIHREVFALRESSLEREDPDRITSMHNLAGILHSRGRYEEAEELYREALALEQSTLGKEHPQTLTSLSSLAVLVRDSRRYKEAEELLREALALKQSVLGKEHPQTLTSMRDLGSVLRRLGKYEEAEESTREALALMKLVQGKEHHATLTSMCNLALILQTQSKYEEAEKLNRETLTLYKLVLGERHPNTLTSMNNLACLWHEQGRAAEAISLMERCFELRTQVIGREHPDTKISLRWLDIWKSETNEQE